MHMDAGGRPSGHPINSICKHTKRQNYPLRRDRLRGFGFVGCNLVLSPVGRFAAYHGPVLSSFLGSSTPSLADAATTVDRSASLVDKESFGTGCLSLLAADARP